MTRASSALRRVERAAARKEAARSEYRAALLAARVAGSSLAEIAAASSAGGHPLTRQAVHALTRAQPPA